jgi:hypothetical protein
MIEIKFQSDSDQEFRGFRISYKSIKCENSSNLIDKTHLLKPKLMNYKTKG